MNNLQIAKIHTLKAHHDRLINTAEELAMLSAGETIAGRLGFSFELARLSVGLQSQAATFERIFTECRIPLEAQQMERDER